MLPEFYDGIYLPDGDHEATWPEVRERFCFGTHRRSFCNKLEAFIRRAKQCKFVRVYLFGSFISSAERPKDVDLLWVYEDLENMTPQCRALIDYAEMRRTEGWDVFCCSNDTSTIDYLLEGFRKDKKIKEKRRGIVIIDLSV